MNKKEAIAEYKMRKPERGAFAVRFAPAGPVWVDTNPDLRAARNSLLFGLRGGLHPNKELQAEWNAHGEAAFQFEVLEVLDDDLSPMAWRDLLKEKKIHWLAELGAKPVFP